VTDHRAHSETNSPDGISRRALLGRSLGTGAALALLGPFGESVAAAARVSGGAQAKQGGRLRVAIPGAGAKEQVHPFNGTTPADVNRRLQLWDPLFSSTSQHSGFKPYLAESAEPNKAGTVWKITLRDGVTDHRGRQLTADDAIWSMQVINDVKAGASGSPFQGYMNLKTGFKRTGKLTFELHLDKALGDLGAIARDTSSIIAPRDWNSDPKHPVGTGPFMFESFTPGQRSLFKRNPNYWNKAPHLDELELITIADGTARANALTRGEVDAVESFDFLQAKQIKSNPAVKLLSAPSEWTIPWMTRYDMAPFKDKRVRLAAKLSVDRPALVKTSFFGFGVTGNDQFGKNGPSVYYNSSLPQRHYDPEHAKSLLKQAGFPNGLDVDLNLAPTCGCEGPEGVVMTAAQAWQQQAKAAGIRFTIKQTTNLDQWNILKFPFSATWWSPGVPFVLNWFTSGSTYNEGWKHPDWDRKLHKALAQQDPSKAKALWNDIQELFYNESGHVVWGHYNLIDGLSPKVRGATSNTWPLGTYGFRSYSFA
jgi:peptide/nickel transport system substrate-binding protein